MARWNKKHCPSLQESLHRVLRRPRDENLFALCVGACSDLLRAQPMEATTQSALQQVTALATLPWADGEARLVAELRVGETLAHNIASASAKMTAPAASDVSAASASSSSVPRWALVSLPLSATVSGPASCHVAPKWRLRVLRKAWFSGDAAAR